MRLCSILVFRVAAEHGSNCNRNVTVKERSCIALTNKGLKVATFLEDTFTDIAPWKSGTSFLI